MSFRLTTKLILAISLTFAPLVTVAETMWLTDILRVNVRTGPSNTAQKLSLIKSGTRMDILETSEDGKYKRIRTGDGLEGWIPTQYLVGNPTGEIRAINLEAEKTQLAQQLDALDKKYKNLLTSKGDVSGEIEELRTNNAELTKELNRIRSISENAINLDGQYQTLSEEYAQIKNEFDVLKSETSSLKEDNDSKMMYAGGFMIFFGIVLGVILPRVTGKRRKEGWS